ncbi:ubiquitin domain-containing protein 7SL RNA1-like [Salvia divinorum]|uniref:Ubiquitin domain-containing protein 7SL RNA1-like n=1 Tax=Salvia divinorum TaxID=28513 RepID=A0ABD1G2H2_SALDI
MDLIFYRSGGNPFCLEVGYFDTILEIKEKIQKEHGFPIPKQTLVFNGALLRDDLNVHHSDILDRSRLHLVLTPDHPAKLRLHLRLPSSPKLVALDMDAKDTIHRLKQRVTELELLAPAPIARLVVGNDLPDHKMLLDCDLGNNSEVAVGLRPGPGGGGLRVVAQYGAEKLAVEVSAGENVAELRKKLQKMNLPKDGYFFIYKQNVMDDDRSFRWHHVGQGDTIEIFSGTVSGGS